MECLRIDEIISNPDLAKYSTFMAEHEPDMDKKIRFQKTYQISKPCKQGNPMTLAEAMSLAMAKLQQKSSMTFMRF